MAKKMKRPIKRAKIARTSSIDKTIAEGNDYVKQSKKIQDKKDKEENILQKARQAREKILARVQRTQKVTTNKRKIPKKVGKSKAPKPAAIPTGSRASAPPARTGSRASQAAIRTNSKNGIMIEQELHDRLDRHKANIGKLNFSLRWWDPNDLDLHVTCPCGTHIYFGNKKCQSCGGQLDIDMNVGTNMSLEPVEHIFFHNAVKGLYQFYVNYFYGPKQFGGVTGKKISKYTLSLHEDYNQILRYEDQVSSDKKEMHYDFTV